MKHIDQPLSTYFGDHLRRVALPLGGIGTGMVSFGGRGDLRTWEICNRPANGFAPADSFFAVWTQDHEGRTVARAAQGPIDDSLFESEGGCIVSGHGLPKFRECKFEVAYPFGMVSLSDPDVPILLSIEAFNPLIPGDSDSSGVPIAVFRFTLTNTSESSLAASVAGTLQNFIGCDGTSNIAKSNQIKFRKDGAVSGLHYSTAGVDPDSEAYGTLALAITTRGEITHREHWLTERWGSGRLDFWDDFSADGLLDPRPSYGEDKPMGSLAVRIDIEPGQSEEVVFLLAWHFPNRKSWTPVNGVSPTVGNYYATVYDDAWDVVAKTHSHLDELGAKSAEFVNAFISADLPESVKEAALNNLSTLRSQTCFRTPDGRFFGWEGCLEHAGSCYGNCTHVWNYEQATAFLFGDLAESMRRTEFELCTLDSGHMSFRVSLPLTQAGALGIAAADGQMGCLMKLYRDWQLTGDDELFA